MFKNSQYNHILRLDDKKYIYNSFTKSSILINSDDFDIEKFDKLNEMQREKLFEQGFLVKNNVDEYEYLKYMFTNNYFGDNFLLNIVLVPGLDCNFKCPYCFEKVPNNNLLFETNQKKYFSVLKQFAKKTLKNMKMLRLVCLVESHFCLQKEYLIFLIT